ncbi:MAG: LysM peptidoglycan-binding domain-containing protein [Candidatus Omnitrophica bacterium]|nr:LysM peptidoglycan-binding domain-containing protein [Candidatus Omnitrophota bacterium]
MKKQNFIFLLVLASIFILSGCVARTYPLTRDRVDQDLTSGNRGYLSGTAPAESTEPRKTDRTVQVFEIELGPSYKVKNNNLSTTQDANLTSDKSESDSTYIAESASSGAFQKYTVEKNDTLQKISTKFYGTSKKWMKIYEANKDVLKGPDKVYPGQVINIPELQGTQTLKEPTENLK